MPFFISCPTAQAVCHRHSSFFEIIRQSASLEVARHALFHHVTDLQYRALCDDSVDCSNYTMIVIRDCARVLRTILACKSDRRVGFSVMQALWDMAHDLPRPDLSEAFYEEISHLLSGVQGVLPEIDLEQSALADATGREAALIRSAELDQIWKNVEDRMQRYENGLAAEAVDRRRARQKELCALFGTDEAQWNDWHWQIRHVIDDPDVLSRAVAVRHDELDGVRRALMTRLPFGITPYYASLMDNDPEKGRDRAVRAQVLPPASYVAGMTGHSEDRAERFDFMRETDTSPVNLVTRRYPAIVILKPFNTCPQICVYCQRNWEIERAMAPGAMASKSDLDRAIAWIRDHPAIREVLVTGGDPLAMSDRALRRILTAVAGIKHVEIIRVGTRTPVTLPMRITEELASMLGSFRRPGVLDVSVITHVEHVYEVTPEFVAAVARLRDNGVSVYNQQVFTFYVSRRFESAALRRLLRTCGVVPYYTFAPKGKEETEAYRVPIARIMQELQEEARLLPGLRRSDAPVYNVPGLGKNHLRAVQHRDLVSILADGSRMYEFHPWEKNIVERESYLGRDVPILTYLRRLEEAGEDAGEYASIWYYF